MNAARTNATRTNATQGSANGLPSTDPYLPGHGDPSYTVRHYDLDLAVALGGNRLDGTATVHLVALAATSRFVFDLAHLRVAKVKAPSGGVVKGFRQSGHRLVIDLKKPVEVGAEVQLQIGYSGRPQQVRAAHHGLAGWEELEDGVIVAAQPHGAPSWFPCNDRMAEKSTYAISVRTDADYRAVANGVLVGRSRQGSSETWRYRLDQPVAPYLATLQIGRYGAWEVPGALEGSGVPIEVNAPAAVTPAVCADSFGRQGEMMAVFVDLFGPYPFAGYRTVITEDDLDIPLESASLSTFGSNFISSDWSRERLIAHELSHQWFGNAVTAASLQHIWLHEGFACYAEWLWSEGSGRESASEWARHHHASLVMPAAEVTLADPGPAEMFEDWVYKRGALTLHVLRRAMGDAAFFALLRTWAQTHRETVVDTDTFLALAAQVSDLDITAVLGPWLFDHALPPLG